ncbi:MAG: ferredoxin reductase family protein [Armatimonadia bacterium]
MNDATGMVPRTKGSPGVGVLLIVIYVAIVITPLLLAWLALPRGDDPFLRELGILFALTAVPVLLLQMVLAARFHWLDRQYGLDMVMRFHKGMAALALVMLIMHPVLMSLASGRWGLLTSLQMPWTIWLGRTALLLLVLQAVLSIYQRHLLSFEKWRFTHQMALLIWVLGWVHSWKLGPDLELLPVKILWVVAGLVTVGLYLYHKVCMPAKAKRDAYDVVEVKQETHDTWTITLKPPAGLAHFPYWPGQFGFIALYRPGRPFSGEEHHFTISSSPTQPGIHTSTIKESGDFTRTIGQTRPGDKARLRAAYGRFSHVLYPEDRSIVFIAGGIGITPLMSMLRYMRDTQSDQEVVLLCGNKTTGDIVFREELEQMQAAQTPRLKLVHVLSAAGADWQGETGYVDRAKIEQHCGSVAGKAFYVCGPAKMMDMVEAALRDLGVPADSIRQERFYL